MSPSKIAGPTRVKRKSGGDELGNIVSLDIKRGTATIRWLRSNVTREHRLNDLVRC